jgi:hypothetical protein
MGAHGSCHYRSRTKTGENDITVLTLQEVARKVAHLEKTKLDENSTSHMK